MSYSLFIDVTNWTKCDRSTTTTNRTPNYNNNNNNNNNTLIYIAPACRMTSEAFISRDDGDASE